MFCFRTNSKSAVLSISNISLYIKPIEILTSSFFADSKIDEDELEKIYEYDFYLLIDLEKINNHLLTSNLEEIIDKIYRTLDERNKFIGEHK